MSAKGRILGRLATEVADILRGKNKPTFTPSCDGGDYVVITHAQEIVMTGNKWEQKEYITHSGWMGGKKVLLAKQLREKHPEDIIRLAVKRMLPKNKLSDAMLKKLKVYAGSEHPHQAQVR